MENMPKLDEYVQLTRDFLAEYEKLQARETGAGKQRLRKIMRNIDKVRVEAQKDTQK